ncbi:response regulator [Leptospira biflexa]|jgi:CheY-like chemotaxis protein|uniref:Putative response regulator n=1 Tax=Leptospira biflexa serovar Patoc (strain Patoc 1 / ATCC 23582 / Paris) TaxID=456481 RepID=B0SJT1_LEPBP|nr:response regulator [Leptospira biflexa]ABZ96228.1 Putative response regulator [Leptospira biflexa serovar Patoc strain 'Patoc 1 (Paris)']TGM37573.1 response regulator [Leptospira biflexa]TGM40908.1 response regulator [Leptospira biflexa]TGM55694.1 response regulator [Leptospira biflexa]
MTKKNILIVEDEPFLGLNIKQKIESFGFHVIAVVPSGDEAFQIVSEKVPDLILMDINLEGSLDGIETAESLREQFSVPVLFLTGFLDETSKQRINQNSSYAYLMKPFSTDQLKEAVTGFMV